MSKKSPPKTAFYKVTTIVAGDDAEAIVVEATSSTEAATFANSYNTRVEPYPVDKLVAYIQAGGVPIKVPPKQKRPYAKKATKSVSRETSPSPEVIESRLYDSQQGN